MTTRLERTVERRDVNGPALKRASWGAIFGGAFIAVAVMVLLGALGVAIGATTVDPAGDSPSPKALGIGAGIWWLVSGLMALFAGGWAAGRLAGLRRRMEGTLHGVITWALTTAALIFLMTTVIGAMISGAMRVVGAGVSAVGQGAQAVASAAGGAATGQDSPDVAWDKVGAEARELLRQTGQEELQPEEIEQAAEEAKRDVRQAAGDPQELENTISQLFRKARTRINEVDREAATNVLMKRTDMSREEARQTVDRWAGTFENAWQQVQQGGEQVQDTAVQAAQATTSAIAAAAWWTFFYLLLTAIAAGLGGFLGAPRGRAAPGEERVETRETIG